ncbi:hypothetical protein F9L16_11435 [Agarivorans sp. B2Z047]|uniref:hypothetical protein n=1 Tax=Agarivorans sp. B2Z047 TaxID=2652721 RepID=UPI00128AF8B5|nr:hypothetical protein [Agarivorans sp. B2Z047]MPW29604.1 hypothetical protein [Agarivorans sp. B2Z047]UQN45188.1 hypothetical protein LQZ07_12210 [Agarivorans sp. B2Z047]
MRKILVVLLFLLSLISCGNEELVFPLRELQLTIFEQGKPVTECKIKPDSETYKFIEAWFKNNQSGWENKPATYYPHKLLSAKNFTAIIKTSFIVVGSSLRHDISPQVYEALTCH